MSRVKGGSSAELFMEFSSVQTVRDELLCKMQFHKLKNLYDICDV